MAAQMVACKSQLKKLMNSSTGFAGVKWEGGEDQPMTSCRSNATHTPLTPLSFARRHNPSYFGQCRALCMYYFGYVTLDRRCLMYCERDHSLFHVGQLIKEFPF